MPDDYSSAELDPIPTTLDHNQITHSSVGLEICEELLDPISPSSIDTATNFYHFNHVTYPNTSKKMKIHSDTFYEPERRTQVNKLNTTMRGRPCHATSSTQTLYCAISRYGSDMKRPKATKDFLDRLWKGFAKFVDISKLTPVSLEEVSLASAMQLRKICEKGELQDDYFDSLDEPSNIKFFLKSQTKADLKEDSWYVPTADALPKCGQGISAQTKLANHIFGPYVRAAELKIRDALKPGVHLGYGTHPLLLSERVAGKFAGKGYEVDVSQLDQFKGHWSEMFMRDLFLMLGVPEDIWNFVSFANYSWRLVSKFFKMSTSECFHSGRPDTLFSNTMIVLALVGMIFEFEQLHVLLCCGDDVALLAEDARRIPWEFDKAFKISEKAFPSFIGYVLTPSGLVLDVPRMLAKLSNRNFRSRVDFEQYQVAVNDWLNIVTEDNFWDTIFANAYSYGLSFEIIESFLGCLVEFVGLPYDAINTRRDAKFRSYLGFSLKI